MENSLADRTEILSMQGCAVDIITYAFRSEGYNDVEIRAAFDEVYDRGIFDIIVERGIPKFVIKT